MHVIQLSEYTQNAGLSNELKDKELAGDIPLLSKRLPQQTKALSAFLLDLHNKSVVRLLQQSKDETTFLRQ